MPLETPITEEVTLPEMPVRHISLLTMLILGLIALGGALSTVFELTVFEETVFVLA